METTHRAAADAEPLAGKRPHRAIGSIPLALAALSVLAAGACGKPSTVARSNVLLDQTVIGTAQSFAVLAGSTVTNTGTTTVEGDLGVDPGLSVTGFPPGLVTDGSIHAGDAVALQAQDDVVTAYVALAGEAPTLDLTGQDLGGMTLVAGVYHFSSSAQLTGALTLDAQGDPSSVFVFQIGSTLTTASNSSVVVINGAQGCNIFWQVGSSATLGTTTAFKGNILALTSITLNTGASVSGRALARNAAVTLDTNDVSIQSCASSDAGVDSGRGSETGSSSGVSSDTGSESGSGSGGGSDTGSGSGAEAAVDGSGVDAGEAGGSLCCGGVLCGTSCTDLSGDIRNCGSCGNVCASNQFCGGGVCAPCFPVCAGACTDLGADNANCGSCGNACLATETCTSGACVPCSTVCGGACVDPGSDPANCGSCGNACVAGDVCSSGACIPCPTTLCAGACRDLSHDANNCGSCGNTCGQAHACIGGTCVCQ
jgi:hypothetical protein